MKVYKDSFLKGGCSMPFEIIRHDITNVKVDAIVNAANTALQMGGGVCGAIFRAAGAQQLQQACDQIGSCQTGDAVITPAFQLQAKHIIHTVGPIWKGGNDNEEQLLSSCYRNSLQLALVNGCESIAFPLISAGIYGYPKREALMVATNEIQAFLKQHDMHIILVVFEKEAVQLSNERYNDIKAYIDDYYVAEQPVRSLIHMEEQLLGPVEEVEEKLESVRSLEHIMQYLEETFSERLLRLINERGLKDSEVYKRANIDRRLFSKIRSNKDYMPQKKTAIALAISLELTIDDTLDLLKTAGYTLSSSHKFDMIIQYFIEQGIYNIYEINEALFAFEQPLLGV